MSVCAYLLFTIVILGSVRPNLLMLEVAPMVASVEEGESGVTGAIFGCWKIYLSFS